MQFLSEIFKYFTEDSNRLLNKLIVFVLVLATIFTLDLYFGFSHNYQLSNKLSRLEQVSNLLDNQQIGKSDRAKLLKIKRSILERQPLQTRLQNYFIEFDFFDEGDRRNFWFHLVSSSYIFLLTMLVLPFLWFLDKNRSASNDGINTLLIVILIFEPILFFIAIIWASFLSLIPLLNGWVGYNYWLNFGLSLLFIYIVQGVRGKLKTS